MAKTNGKERAVIVTTEHRGVFFGRGLEVGAIVERLRTAEPPRSLDVGDNAGDYLILARLKSAATTAADASLRPLTHRLASGWSSRKARTWCLAWAPVP